MLTVYKWTVSFTNSKLKHLQNARQDQANAAAAQAAEQRRIAALATAESNRLAQELERQRLDLEESRRINNLLINDTFKTIRTNYRT